MSARRPPHNHASHEADREVAQLRYTLKTKTAEYTLKLRELAKMLAALQATQSALAGEKERTAELEAEVKKRDDVVAELRAELVVDTRERDEALALAAERLKLINQGLAREKELRADLDVSAHETARKPYANTRARRTYADDPPPKHVFSVI